MKITLITTVRGYEPLLERTMQLARANAGQPIEIVCVFDGQPHEKYGVQTDSATDMPLLAGLSADIIHILREPRGCMAARHAGIRRASGKLLVICDAHMGFSPDWAIEVSRFYKAAAHKHTVACACMRSAGDNLEPLGDPATTNPYSGARISWKTIEPINGNIETSEPAALGAKWAPRQMPGEQIGCVMGAFYTFTPSWYKDMGEPWKVGTGWGMDEEMISLASWCCGGDVRLLPIRVQVTHKMGDPTSPNRWKPVMADIDAIWLNRIRMVHLFPLSDDERNELQEHLLFNAHTLSRPTWHQTYERDLARPEVAELRAHLADKGPALRAYLGKWVDRPPLDQRAATAARFAANRTTMAPMLSRGEPLADERYRLPQQVVHRRVEICSLCDARNKFIVTRTIGTRRYAKCGNCGRPAVILESGEIKHGVEMFQ